MERQRRDDLAAVAVTSNSDVYRTIAALQGVDAALEALRLAKKELQTQAERIRELEQQVTQHRADAERYHRERDEAEERDRAKSQALVETAHELRSPLGTIAGWLKMLDGNRPSETIQARAVSSMTRCVRGIVRIVEDLLDHGRIENDRMVLKLETLNVVRLLVEVLEDLRPLAALKKLRLVFSADSHRIDVRADAWRLQQVFKNLLGNAIKFTPEQGSIQLKVTKADFFVEVAITDTGRGIPPNALHDVFTPFFQVGAPGTRHTGLGLGLSITRRIVELHQGTIRAESSGAEAGSTFTVRLPLLAPN